MAVPDIPTDQAIDISDLARRVRESPDPNQALVQVGRSFGHRGIEQVVLHNAVREAQLGHRLAGYPARVFVSYRWDDCEHRAWVERMSVALREAGYDVTLDQWEPEVTTLADVPRLVSRIARSHVVLVVVSRGYVDAVKGTEKPGGSIVDGWVFDEYRLTRSLQEAGLCDVVLVYRDGSGLPGTRRRDRVVDARTAAESPAHLADVIGHSRLRLSEEQLSRLVAFEQIVGRALVDGDLATVRARLEADADLAGTGSTCSPTRRRPHASGGRTSHARRWTRRWRRAGTSPPRSPRRTS